MGKSQKILLAVFIVLCLAGGGIASLWRGPDHGFDNMNYHIYNAWALLHGRFGVDLYPADFRSYFYPILDIPYYLLSQECLPDSPRTVAFLMGIPAGILFLLCFALAWKFIGTLSVHGITPGWRLWHSTLATFLGMSGISIVLQVGYTSNEIPVACLVIGGMLAFLQSSKKPGVAGLLSGTMLGMATGLKLTAHVFVIPLLVCIFFFYPTWRERIRASIAFCAAWWVTFLAIFGWWGWTLYKMTGNPVFPAMNNLFKSDWIPHDAGMDNRFIPHDMKHILFYPFYWYKTACVTDGISTDIRFLFAYTVAAGSGISLLLRGLAKSIFSGTGFQFACKGENAGDKTPAQAVFKRSFFFITTFVVLSYIVWEFQFSTLRYAIPIECLLGVFIFACASQIFRVYPNFPKNIPLSALLLLCTLTALATDAHERPRVAFGNVFHPEIPRLPENTLLLAFPGTLFLAPKIVEINLDAAFVGGFFELPSDKPARTWRKQATHPECGVKEMVRNKINKHTAEFRVLAHDVFDFDDPAINEKCTQYGIVVSKEDVKTLKTNFGTCKLYKATRLKEFSRSPNP
ncbi:MAG: DUF2029 domain-containing protein [Puniceicoccales bacterium]|nr:DUF2029 domain-containing protein [Puniceicoccales bacterium]